MEADARSWLKKDNLSSTRTLSTRLVSLMAFILFNPPNLAQEPGYGNRSDMRLIGDKALEDYELFAVLEQEDKSDRGRLLLECVKSLKIHLDPLIIKWTSPIFIICIKVEFRLKLLSVYKQTIFNSIETYDFVILFYLKSSSKIFLHTKG